MRSLPKSAGRMGLVFLSLVLAVGVGAKETAHVGPTVAVVRTAGWSEGDPAKEGAAEMVVLLEIARVRHQSPQGGLVAVGDRRGLFSNGAEEALRRAVLQGVPVVKLAVNGRVLPAPHGLFLDGGALSEEEAQRMLAHCLEKFGSLPSEKNASRLHERLRQYQQEFTLAAGTRLAAR